MTFLPFLLNRSRLPICSYNLFLFWPVTLKSVKKKKYYCMYIDKQNQFKKNKKKSIYACISLKKKKYIYACICRNKNRKKKKKKYLCMYIEKHNQLKKKKDKCLVVLCFL